MVIDFSPHKFPGDFLCPDGVTLTDTSFFAQYWLTAPCNPANNYCASTDLNLSGMVDTPDLFLWLENWLTRP